MGEAVFYKVQNLVHLMKLDTGTWKESKANAVSLEAVHMETREAKKSSQKG